MLLSISALRRSATAFTLALLPIAACAGAVQAPNALPSVQDASVFEEAAALDASDASDANDGDANDANETIAVATPCPAEMAQIGATCIDRWEAMLVATDGSELHWYDNADKVPVRAETRNNVFPSGYVSRDKAEEACTASGKRLCSLAEWRTACMGTEARAYPYGAQRIHASCNDSGKSPLGIVFPQEWAALQASIAKSPARSVHHTPNGKAIATGKSGKSAGVGAGKSAASRLTKGKKASKKPGKTAPAKTTTKKGGIHSQVPNAVAKARRAVSLDTPEKRASWAIMNDPRLLQVEGALARTGSFAVCKTPEGIHDLVGNLHEWVSDDWNGNGIFAGGYFLDTTINGEGCMYSTRAHSPAYHDYSIGFRCCQDARDVERDADAGPQKTGDPSSEEVTE